MSTIVQGLYEDIIIDITNLKTDKDGDQNIN